MKRKVRREREHMFNIVGKFLFRNELLEKAIEEVLMEEQSLHQSSNTGFDIWGANNLAWKEGDTWYGWTYSYDKNRYFFDDIGSTSLMELWEVQWQWEDLNT